MGGGTTGGAHEFEKFETSSYTKFKHIQIDPLTAVAPTPSSRGALANEGALLGSKAELGDKMATETQSDEAPFWIVEVEGKEQEVPRDYVCPLTAAEHVDVIFEFPRGKMALLVRRLRPMVTLRGEPSHRLLEIDSSVAPFLVPCHLLRLGKIKLKEATITPPRASARLSGGSGVLSVAPVVRYELKAADKALVLERCRVF